MLGVRAAQAATVQQMFDALPDASAVATMTDDEKQQACNDLNKARQSW